MITCIYGWRDELCSKTVAKYWKKYCLTHQNHCFQVFKSIPHFHKFKSLPRMWKIKHSIYFISSLGFLKNMDLWDLYVITFWFYLNIQPVISQTFRHFVCSNMWHIISEISGNESAYSNKCITHTSPTSGLLCPFLSCTIVRHPTGKVGAAWMTWCIHLFPVIVKLQCRLR